MTCALTLQRNTTDTSITLAGLDKGAHYNIFVVAKNEHGTSLPSAVILVKIAKAGECGNQ